MSRDILGEYGPESSQPQVSRAGNGGKQTPKDIPYEAPKGPSNIRDPKTPGIHGTNHPCGSQGKH